MAKHKTRLYDAAEYLETEADMAAYLRKFLLEKAMIFSLVKKSSKAEHE